MDIKNSILNLNPLPSNITGPAALDDYIRGLLVEQRKISPIIDDKSASKLQQKVVNVLGPLAKLWAILQSALTSQQGCIEVEMEDLNELIEQ